jgi:hypothetical protein
MQRYIAASVQRRDSNVSTNGGMVDDGLGFFSRSPSKLLLEVVDEAGETACSVRGGATTEMS